MHSMAKSRRSKRGTPAPPPAKQRTGILVALVLLAAAAFTAWFFHSGSDARAASPEPMAAVSANPAQVESAPRSRHIYSETADPNADIAAALKQARSEHKRVLLDFGGDWCGDCQVLDIYFHQAPNDQILQKNFILVHVWIGHMDAHVDVAERYGVPLNKGVPALAVLAPNGKVLYAQKTGEFEKMRSMNPGSVTEFLEKWKS